MAHAPATAARAGKARGGEGGGLRLPSAVARPGPRALPPAANASALLARAARLATPSPRDSDIVLCDNSISALSLDRQCVPVPCVVCEHEDVQCADCSEELTAEPPGDEKLCYATDRGDYPDLGLKPCVCMWERPAAPRRHGGSNAVPMS